jgi:hypothetical protein
MWLTSKQHHIWKILNTQSQMQYTSTMLPWNILMSVRRGNTLNIDAPSCKEASLVGGIPQTVFLR